jgi:putative restriction endonuclease
MPSLPQHVLYGKVAAAVPGAVPVSQPTDTVPAIFDIPHFGRAFLHVWTCTADHSAHGRPDAEYKIQLIMPGQARTQTASFLGQPGAFTAMLGYSPEFGVFVGWEAAKHPAFAFSTNAQVRRALLEEARQSGWAVAAPRRVAAGSEVRVAFSSANLMRFLTLSRDADLANIAGIQRESYFLDPIGVTSQQVTQDQVNSARMRILVERLKRDPTFSPRVREQYEFNCAVCGSQLEIVEAAHIIGVSEPNSTDETWNGVCLCPNHHALFDSRLLNIRDNLIIVCDEDSLSLLEQEGSGGGADTLLRAFHGKPIRAPLFWGSDHFATNSMRTALATRFAASALQ